MPLGSRPLGVFPPEALRNRGRSPVPAPPHRPGVDLPPRSATRRWPWILASVAAHVLLFLGLTATLQAPPDSAAATQEVHPDEADREVAMVYLAPPEAQPKPAPQPPPPSPQAQPEPPRAEASRSPSQKELPPPGEQRDEVLSPAPAAETKNPDALRPAERDAPQEAATAEAEKPNALSTDKVAEIEDRAPALAGAARPGATMEEEARRIFGRPTTGTGTRNNALPWASDSACIPEPDPADLANGPVLDSIMGQVLDMRGQPLVGAHLQIVGTSYHGFSGAGGMYRLVFDVSLVANCRVQVVRVSAPGYRGRDLYLAMGRGSNDVVLQR